MFGWYTLHTFCFKMTLFILTRMLFFQETIIFTLCLVSASLCQPKHTISSFIIEAGFHKHKQNFLKRSETSFSCEHAHD